MAQFDPDGWLSLIRNKWLSLVRNIHRGRRRKEKMQCIAPHKGMRRKIVQIIDANAVDRKIGLKLQPDGAAGSRIQED